MIVDKLKNLNQNKVCTPDNMHPFLLKHCVEAFAVPLTLTIIGAFFTNSQLPVQFKSANVTPLFKKGSKTVPSNYCQVSLTSILGKIMENIIRAKMEEYLYKNNLLGREQRGFVKNKSCTTNLSESLNYISSNLDVAITVDVILLDFAKAFDTVPHKRLFAKLKAYGFDGPILKWVEAFLESRRQRVQGEIISDWVKIFSGEPQGSEIAALLLVLYINDLPRKLLNVTKLYADDTKVISQLSSEICATNLQTDLDNAYKCSQT